MNATRRLRDWRVAALGAATMMAGWAGAGEALPPESYAAIVQRVAPSVVTVFTSKKGSQDGPEAPQLADPSLRDLFGEQLPREGDREAHGLGSGVIVSSEGEILTANHVIAGADEILVSLGMESRRYVARKIGTDPGTDIALLKIEGQGFPAVHFANSDQAKAGDRVLAVGNPFGLRQTVTSGIISAVGRGGMGIIDYENFIQTDAAINMGNSGGALVNLEGELVGINSAILSRSGGNQGIGFAIPANLARAVMQSLSENGRVIRGYLGTLLQPLTPDLAEALEIKGEFGALVREVSRRSPAEKAGVKSGDVIVSVNGKKIGEPRELRLLIGSMPPGAEVELELFRDGKSQRVEFPLAELPSGQDAAEAGDAQSDKLQLATTKAFGGVVVADVNEELRQNLNLPREVDGAVIVGLDATSAAVEAGLRQGDVIQELNKHPVRGAKDLAALTQALKRGNKALLRVWSEGKCGYVALAQQ